MTARRTKHLEIDREDEEMMEFVHKEYPALSEGEEEPKKNVEDEFEKTREDLFD